MMDKKIELFLSECHRKAFISFFFKITLKILSVYTKNRHV
jgi:hypothetical protein